MEINLFHESRGEIFHHAKFFSSGAKNSTSWIQQAFALICQGRHNEYDGVLEILVHPPRV